ncbi:MAG: polysaccharide deacetylase family protein [Marmoricola sp.]
MDSTPSQNECHTEEAQAGKWLGYPANARRLIVSCDDLGIYPSATVAIVRAVERGIASSCSLLVPGPSAARAMQALIEHPHIDFGIHLTLVSDFDAERWRPLTDPAQVSTLVDHDGYLRSTQRIPSLLARARIDEVERELRTQINTVLDRGLQPSHLDWHCMADGGRDDIFDLTVSLAREHGLAARVWLDPGRRKMRAARLPVVDHPFLDSFTIDVETKHDYYLDRLASLPPGLSEWAVHPAIGDDETRNLDPGWRVRQSDLDFLTSPEAQKSVTDQGIVLSDYQWLQAAWSATSDVGHGLAASRNKRTRTHDYIRSTHPSVGRSLSGRRSAFEPENQSQRRFDLLQVRGGNAADPAYEPRADNGSDPSADGAARTLAAGGGLDLDTERRRSERA